MIDSGRTYMIICCKDNLGLFVPPGARDSPEPLRCMPHGVPPSPIRVEHLGGDRYKLIPAHFPDRFIAAYHNASPKELLLASQDEVQFCYTEWGIDRNGPDQYEIHALTGPGNEYWTSEGNGVGICLQGSEGKETQQWRLVPADDY